MTKKVIAALLTLALAFAGTAQAAVPAYAASETQAETEQSEGEPVLLTGASGEAGSDSEALLQESEESPAADTEASASEESLDENEGEMISGIEETDGETEQVIPEDAESVPEENAEETSESGAELPSEPGESDLSEADESVEAIPEESLPEEAESIPAVDESGEEEELLEEAEATPVGIAPPISEGDYYIFSALADKAVFDIAGGLRSNGANLQLYQLNRSDAQKFHVSFNKEGLAVITAVHSGKALDAAGRGRTVRTNVRQYTSNGTAAQLWEIKKSAQAGYYTIKASYTDLVLDAEGGSSKNKTNISLYTSNNTKSQQWKFVPVSEFPDIKPAAITSGYYRINMAKNEARCMEVDDKAYGAGANIAVGPSGQKAAQVFYVHALGSGWYTLESCLSGCMVASEGSTAATGINISVSATSGSNSQRWYITECGGLYTIASGVDQKYVVDVRGALTSAGTNIRLYESNDSIAQKWVFAEADEPVAVLPGGTYSITCAANAAMAVSIPAKNAAKGSNAALSVYSGNNFQKFVVTPLGDGTYKLIVAGSAMALDVAGGSKANNANVQQYSYNGTMAQRWKIVGCRGIFKIIGAGSGKALDAASGKLAAGTNLQLYTDNGTKAQQFKFTPVSTAGGSAVVTQEGGKTYAVDPATGKKFQIEPEYLNDPRVGVDVSVDDFFAAVLYTEAGGQGTDGMLMVAYVIKNRMAKGIEAARKGAYVEYPGTLDIMIYQKEQWQVARTKDNGDPAPLGNVLRDILHGTADYLDHARQVVALANKNADIVLARQATIYTKTSENSSNKTTMAAGIHIKAADFKYNSFMTPKAWLRYAQDNIHRKFKADFMGNNAFLYSGAEKSQGHVFFLDEEVW